MSDFGNQGMLGEGTVNLSNTMFTQEEEIHQQQQQQQSQQLSNGNNAIAYHFNTSTTRNVYDWYQTNTHVIINIMIKNLKEADVKVKLIDETLDVTCDLADGSIFKLHFNLFKPIYVQDSNWSVTPSKLEIQLKKTDRKRWQSLELIPEKTKPRNSHSNHSHNHHHNHNNNQQHHSQQQQLKQQQQQPQPPQTQPSPPQQQQQQQQLQTQIETLASLESEVDQQLLQATDQLGDEVKVKPESDVQCHTELVHVNIHGLQSESSIESEMNSQDQTQPQSPPQSQLASHEQLQQIQQVQPQSSQFSFNNKSSPEELEFLSNSVELSSTLIELDFVLS